MILSAFYIFWLSTLLVFYTYVGYGVVIYIFSKIKRPTPIPKTGTHLPEVTLLIAAYNEEAFIEEKISNTLALDYPKDKLRIMIVTDGSTDSTPELVAKHPSIQLFHEPERRGKI